MKKFVCLVVAFLFFTCLFGCENKENDLAQEMVLYRANKITAYKTENEKYDDYEVDVAFLGDSLTDAYDVATYYPSYVVSNRGIAGDTTVGIEERLQVSLYDLKPKVAVMLIGANNLTEMFSNYQRILTGFTQNVPKTKIILLSLTSMGGDWGKNNQLAAYNNVKIKMLAEQYGFGYVDLYTPLLNLETGEIYAEYTTDGGHLTSLGYQVLTREITPAIEEALATWTA